MKPLQDLSLQRGKDYFHFHIFQPGNRAHITAQGFCPDNQIIMISLQLQPITIFCRQLAGGSFANYFASDLGNGTVGFNPDVSLFPLCSIEVFHVAI